MELLKLLMNEQPIELKIGIYTIKVTITCDEARKQLEEIGKVRGDDQEHVESNIFNTREALLKEIEEELYSSSSINKLQDKPYPPSEDFFKQKRIHHSTIDLVERIARLVMNGKTRKEIGNALNLDYHREYRYRRILGHVCKLLESTPNKVYIANTTGFGRETLSLIENFIPEITQYVGTRVYLSL